MAVIAIAAGAVHLYFDSARLTPLAQARLQALSKREIHLGRVALTWLPRPGLTVHDVRVANPPWTHERDLLRAQTITLRPRLLLLLGGHLEFDSIAASGVSLNLESGADDQDSWQGLFVAEPGSDASVTTTDPVAGSGKSRPAPGGFRAPANVMLSGARISYRARDRPATAWDISSLSASSSPGWRMLAVEASVDRDGQRLTAAIRLDDASAAGQPGANSAGSARLSWDGGFMNLDGFLPLAIPPALHSAATRSGPAGTSRAIRGSASGTISPTTFLGTAGSTARNTSAAVAGNASTGIAATAHTDNSAPALETGKAPGKQPAPPSTFRLQLQASSMTALLSVLQLRSEPVAALAVGANVTVADTTLHVADIVASLGKQTLRGELIVSRESARPTFRARIAADHIDWAQLTADAGRPPPPPVPPDQVFYTHDLAWPALVAMKPVDGHLDLDFKGFRTRSGIEVSDLQAGMQFRGDQLDVREFRFNAFGGSASGSLKLDGPRKGAHLEISTRAISLGQWFEQKTRKNLFTGAPMDLTARVDATGASMKQLAATLTGPVSMRIGPARVLSAKAEKAETLLTGLFTVFPDKTSDHLELACINARLPFVNGVARATPIAGARSSSSKLLTRGELDLRRQTIDLRGRLRPHTGINLGVASITGDVRISGLLRKPGMHLAPLGTPAAVARVGAAIVTGGLSLVATAAWDAAVKGEDPCDSIFAYKPK